MAKGRILVIDSEEFYQRFYGNLLVSEGFEARVAETAEQALDCLKQDEFDLVITDLKLADMDGLDIIDAIRRFDPQQDILVATARDETSLAVQAMKLDIADYLVKPVNPEELQLHVNRILFQQSVGREHQKLLDENIEYNLLLSQYQKCLEFLKVEDLDRLGELVLDTLMDILSAEGSVLWLADDDKQQFRIRSRRGLARPQPGEEKIKLGEFEQKLFKNGRVMLMRDDKAMAVPVLYNESPQGIVRIEAPSARETFNRRDMRIAELVADFAGTALHHARHVQELERGSLKISSHEVYNMAYFRDTASREIYKSRRYNRRLSYIRLSIDNFKAVRGAFHDHQLEEAHDELVAMVNEVLRDADIIARDGDGAYNILLPETDYWGSLVAQKRIRNALNGKIKLSSQQQERAFDIYMRSASFPVDGDSLETLEKVAESRLERLRSSIMYRSDMTPKPFWDVTRRILGPPGDLHVDAAGVIVPPNLQKFEVPRKSRYVYMPKSSMAEIMRAFCREVVESSRVRGVIYCGCRDFNAIRNSLRFRDEIERTATTLFLLGGEKRTNWDMERIVPIYIKDESFARTSFLLYLNEDYAYAFFAHPTEDGLLGYHSSDFYFVENMIAKIQEQYNLRAQG